MLTGLTLEQEGKDAIFLKKGIKNSKKFQAKQGEDTKKNSQNIVIFCTFLKKENTLDFTATHNNDLDWDLAYLEKFIDFFELIIFSP